MKLDYHTIIEDIEAQSQPKNDFNNLEGKVERNRLWVQLYKNGRSATSIAAEYGVSRERVCQILRPYDVIEDKRLERIAVQLARVEARLAKKQACREKVEKVVGLVKSGLSWADAGALVGLTRRSMHHQVRNLGVKSQHGRWRDFTERKRIIKEMRAEQKTWDEIGKALGLTPSAINNWAFRNMPELFHDYVPRNSITKRKKKNWSEREAFIRQAREDGVSWQDISSALGLSSVYSWVQIHMPELINQDSKSSEGEKE